MQLDYERYFGRAENAKRKEAKSARDESALMKIESDLELATHEYQAADDQIKRGLPPVIDAISALLPHLLSTQIMIQHSLVANLYTALHGYCQQQGMPVNPPSLDAVVSTWDASFSPLRHEIEGEFAMLLSGKAVHQPMELPDTKQGTITGLGLRDQFAHRKKSSHGSLPRPSMPSFLSRGGHEQEVQEAPPSKPTRPGTVSASQSYVDDEEEAPPAKPPRPGSSSGNKLRIPSSRMAGASPSPSPYDGGMISANGLRPTGSPYKTSATPSDTPYLSPQGSYTPSQSSPGSDYFGRERKPSTSSGVSGVLGKKKPPPPPPKRLASTQAQFVTALYDFAGQNEGDLSFQEGDQIRVVKKTESMNDWWKGEIRGVTGSFPANYVQV